MESVFNINPDNIKVLPFKNDFKYTFLDAEADINIKPYYDLINSYEDYKIKNIYHFLFLRSLKINKKFNEINEMKLNKGDISPERLNELLNHYINNDKIREIIIMNGIQLYFYPTISS